MIKKFRLPLLMVIFLAVFVPFVHGADAKVLDPADMDKSVKPGDDFYTYANGTWVKNNPVPDQYTRWTGFDVLRDKNLSDLRTILEEAAADKNAPAGSAARKIGDFYSEGMDKAKVEALGITPLQKEFKRIDAIKDANGVQDAIAHFHAMGIGMLFNLFVEQDQTNSEMNIGWMYQGGLGLPDRDYYTQKDERSQKIREEYVVHLTNMFILLKESPEAAKKAAQTVMAFETRLAEASMTQLEQRDPKARFHKKTLAQFDKLTPSFNFTAYFKGIGLPKPGDLNMAQPKFFTEISTMMKEVPVEDWKTYMRFHLLRGTAGYLSTPFATESFRFYGQVLSGQKKQRSRWKRCLTNTSGSLGHLVSQLYVNKYFPPKAKKRAYTMVMNLKKAFAKRIQNLQWMGPETKKKALAKLESFGVKIGYPDKWIDYSSLEVKRDAYVLNILRARRFAFKRDLDKMGKPIDPTDWAMMPQTVNAYYHPLMNEIVFPAAILQPPFFDFNADDAVNYGAMGAVIGHEMTHGFDDSGRQFDKDGNVKDWWTKGDAEKFDKRTAKLVTQYNNFKALPDATVDGKLTLGENIADLGGLSIAYDALLQTLPENPKKIDGFTPQQRFFLGWAKIWRGNILEKSLRLALKTDVHSPGKFRVLGPLVNMPQFFEAFDVKPGDKMYLPKEKQALIW